MKNVEDNSEHINKCIVQMREEEIPIFENVNKFKVQTRVFKKDTSVFKDFKEDTTASLQMMVIEDLKNWKVSRFIKDEADRERVERLLQKHFLRIKRVFTSFISQSSFP